MKRWIAILVTAMLAILQTGAFAECDDEISNYTRYADYIPQAAEPVGLIPGENHRTLVVWFSRVGNTVFDPDVDVVSSATLNRGKDGALVGNAQMIAGWITEETKADVFQIQTAYTYPSDYDQTVQVGEGQDIDHVDRRWLLIWRMSADMTQYGWLLPSGITPYAHPCGLSWRRPISPAKRFMS